jgi:EamA domain-containing membrane protein RarD
MDILQLFILLTGLFYVMLLRRRVKALEVQNQSFKRMLLLAGALTAVNLYVTMKGKR